VKLWWARCDLLEQAGDQKKAIEGYQQILKLLPKEDGEGYMQLARDMARVHIAHFVLHAVTVLLLKFSSFH